MKRILLAMLVVLSLFSASVLAVDINVDINGIELVEELDEDGNSVATTIVNVERGETLDLTVYLMGDETEYSDCSEQCELDCEDVDCECTDDCEADCREDYGSDVNIRAWIGGYEYDNVEVVSEMFDIEPGVSYVKHLNLEIPSDLEADKDYTLHIEIYDDTESEEYDVTINVDQVRHLLDIYDVLVDSAVDSGDYTTVTVRLENMGENKEEDIKVTVSVAELGISKSVFLDELTNFEIDNEDEESSGEVDLTFEVPEDAETGDYALNVLVSYNNGYDTLESTSTLHVDGAVVEEAQEDSTVTVVVEDSTEESGNDFSTALKLGFGILAVLIVILALILIVRR